MCCREVPAVGELWKMQGNDLQPGYIVSEFFRGFITLETVEGWTSALDATSFMLNFFLRINRSSDYKISMINFISMAKNIPIMIRLKTASFALRERWMPS